MKQSNRKRKSSAKKVAQPSKPLTKSVDRRGALGRLQFAGLGLALLAGGGWWFFSEVNASIDEMDLSRIGNGIPAVVQVHDPQCPQCTALQKEARVAVSTFDTDELQYLVANLRQDEGAAFANAHGAQKVTLILFDAAGKRRSILRGPHTAERLKEVFRRHIATPAAS